MLIKKIAGICYQEWGVGPPIICMHGIGGDHNSFYHQRVLSEDFRVISWCMPGYGDSDVLESVTFEALALALKKFMDQLQIKQAHLLGQSIGGMIAQEFYHRFPARVISLCLIATTSSFGGRDDTFKQEFLKLRLKPLENGKSLSCLASDIVASIVGPAAHQEAIDMAVTSMSQVSDNCYKSILECLITFDRRSAFSGITVPCCLIAGETDTNSPAKTMKKMADLLHGSDYYVIHGAGHLVHLECPTETNVILKNFMNNLPGTKRGNG
jgi:3-oxoadipate enol-lactonase